MTTQELSKKLGISDRHIKKYKGQFRYHRSYFYGFTSSADALVKFIKDKLPDAIITDSGNHFHSFVGGAASGTAKDSFLWVTFKI